MSHIKRVCEFVDELAGESSRVFFNPDDYKRVFLKHGRGCFEPYVDVAMLRNGWVGCTTTGGPVGVSRQVERGTVVVAPLNFGSDQLVRLKAEELPKEV